MTETFACPTCGAPLKYEGGPDFTFPCPYCGNSVIVPENIRSPSARSAKRHPLPAEKVDQTAVFQKIQELLKAGKKIEAIKLHRYCYPEGLVEAKKIVEGIEAGTVTELPACEVDAGILANTDAKSSNAACLIFALLVLGPILIALIIPGITSLSRKNQSASSAVAATRSNTIVPPTAVPLATSVPAFLTQTIRFGGEGTGPGKFKFANDIAIAPDGLVYVGDRDLSRIEVFDATGIYLTQWILDPQDHYRGLAVDTAGVLFVNEGGRIYRYDRQTGKRIGEIKYQDASGDTADFDSMVALPNGGLAASWINMGVPSDDILIFDSAGSLVTKIERAVTGPADWGTEGDIQLAVDGTGNLYALGTVAQTVVKYSPSGKFLNRFGERGDKPGQFAFESFIAIDSQGMVYVFGNHNIIFDANGLLINTFEIANLHYGPIFDLSDHLFISTGTEVIEYNLFRPK
jgi:hypothetical protein